MTSRRSEFHRITNSSYFCLPSAARPVLCRTPLRHSNEIGSGSEKNSSLRCGASPNSRRAEIKIVGHCWEEEIDFFARYDGNEASQSSTIPLLFRRLVQALCKALKCSVVPCRVTRSTLPWGERRGILSVEAQCISSYYSPTALSW